MAHSSESYRYRRLPLILGIVAALQAVYALMFIWRSSFVVEGHRYFCLFDDAMISMRYAHNWASGLGLVWNPGEHVEGYTNFAWTLLMGLVHLGRFSPSISCLLVQLLGLATLWGCLWATARLGVACRFAPLAVSLALPIVGFCYFLTFFSLMGMETGLLVMLVTMALASAARVLNTRQGSLAPMLWFGVALLVRIDAALPAALTFLFLLLLVRSDKRRLLAGMLGAGVLVGSHVLWRHHYYGDWLPNTYYLKATGWKLSDRLEPGISQTLRTGAAFMLCLLFAGISLLACRKPSRILLVLVLVAVLGYQTYVGGDAWAMDRFALPALPGLALLAGDGILRATMVSRQRWMRRAVAVVLTMLAVANVNIRVLPDWLFLRDDYSAVTNQWNVRLAIAIERATDSTATIGVGAAGVVPYFCPKRVCYDLLGKCDRYIAHLPAHPEVTRAGHNKFDMTYTIEKQRPDVLLHSLSIDTPGFQKNYIPMAVTVDGERVLLCVRRTVWAHSGDHLSDAAALEILQHMFPESF